LQEIAAEAHEGVALLRDFNTFAHDHHAHVMGELGHGPHQLLLGRVQVHVSHESHVELDDLRLQQRKARQPCIPRPQIVDRDAEAHLPERGDAGAHVFDRIERSAFGDFENDVLGDLRQRRVRRHERRIEQVGRVQIDEQHRPRWRVTHRQGGPLADGPAEHVEHIESLGGVEHRSWMWQRSFSAAEQRLVTVDVTVRCSQDRLIRHPQRLERLVEAGLEGSTTVARQRALDQLGCLALHASHASQARGLVDHLFEAAERDWLSEVVECSVLERLHGGAHRGFTGDQHDRYVRVVLTQLFQQLNSVHLRHGDIGDDDVELSRPKRAERAFAIAFAHHVVAFLGKDAADAPQQGRFVVDNEDVSSGHIRTRHYPFPTSGPLVGAARWRGHGRDHRGSIYCGGHGF
jgi:hypothetical protein